MSGTVSDVKDSTCLLEKGFVIAVVDFVGLDAFIFFFQPGALSCIRVVDIAVLIRVTAGRQRWRRRFHHGGEARLRLLDAVAIVGVVVIVVVLPDSVLNEELCENAVAMLLC